MKNDSKLRFSIITVCYNEEKMIRATMESVLNQKWQNFEYIIVDGGSTDATIQIVCEYAEDDSRIRWYSKEDKGIYNAMNKGIRLAEGDFLFFLNAGDVLHSNQVLQKVAETITATQAEIVIGDMADKNERGLKVYSNVVGTELYENLQKGKSVCHQAIFASKDCLKDGFDERYIICADYNWLCEQVNLGRKIEKADTVIADFDVHGISRQIKYRKLRLQECLDIVKRNFPKNGIKTCDEMENSLTKERRNRYLYEFMNQWLILKQQGVDISSFFTRRGISTIAIYGMHYMGQRLYDELKNSQVKVMYAIDTKLTESDCEVVIVRPDNQLEKVDAVVITPVFDYWEIKNELLKKIDCPMISIEDILFFGYYGELND